MNADWLGLGSRTDIESAPRGTRHQFEKNIVVVQTPERPDFWFGNYIIVPEPSAADVQRYADFARQRLPEATRDIVVWETQSASPAEVPPAFDYERRSVLRLRRGAVVAPSGRAQPVRDDSEWRAVLELILTDAEGSPGFWSWYAGAMRERCACGDGTWFSIERAGLAICALGVLNCGPYVRFAHVVTRPSERRAGLANELVQHAVSIAGDGRNCVIVAADGSDAQRLYERIGFTRVATQHVLVRMRSV